MSYSGTWDASNYLHGTIDTMNFAGTGGSELGISVICWVNRAWATTGGVHWAWAIQDTSAVDNTNAIGMRANGTNTIQIETYNSAGTRNGDSLVFAGETAPSDDDWVCVLTVYEKGGTNLTNDTRNTLANSTGTNYNTETETDGDTVTDADFTYLKLGRGINSTAYWDGKIHSIAIYNGIKTASDLTSLVTTGGPNWTGPDLDSLSNCVHYWKFDGTDQATWTDLVGGSRTLTRTGSPTFVTSGDPVLASSTNETVYPFTGPWR